MGEELDPVIQQSDALERIRQEWNLSLGQLADALGRSRSQATRWEHPYDPQMMSSESRLRLARFIGSRFWHLHKMEAFLSRVGWCFTDTEWREALHHLDSPVAPHRIPWVDLDQFLGRDRELSRLETVLLERGATAPRIVLVEGMPGVGKTWLVARLLQTERTMRERFRDGILWLSTDSWADRPEDGGSKDRLLSSLVSQVLETHSQCGDRAEWSPRLRRKLRSALSRKSVLLVIDGVTERIDLDQWMVVDPTVGRLLVTTRRTDLESQRWRGRVQTIQVGKLGRGASRELLTRDVEHVDVRDQCMSWLLEELGGLPIGLDIANRLAQQDKGLTALMKQLRETSLSSLAVKPPVCIQDSLELTFGISYRRLGVEAARLFRALGISPQPFESSALAEVMRWDEAKTGRRLRRLTQHGLLRAATPGRYRTHHLIHEYADTLSRREDEAYRKMWKERFANHYLDLTKQASRLWDEREEPEALHLWAQHSEHIEAGCQYAAQLQKREWVRSYLTSTGYQPCMRKPTHMLNRWRSDFELLGCPEGGESPFRNLKLDEAVLLLGGPKQAVPLLRRLRRRAEELDNEQLWLSMTLKLAQSLSVSGAVFDACGFLSRERYETALANLAPGHPLRVEVLGVAGRVSHMAGRYEEASRKYRKALVVLSREETPHQEWRRMKLLYQLGGSRLELGRHREALEAFEEADKVARAAGYEKTGAVCRANVIIALARMGQVEEAKEQLGMLRPELGRDEDLQAWSRLAQAELLWATGRYSQAKIKYEAASEVFTGTSMQMSVRDLLTSRLKEEGQIGECPEDWQTNRMTAGKQEDVMATT